MCMMVISADELLAMVTYDLSLSTYVYSASILMVLRQSITCCGFTNIRWYHGLFRGNVKLRTMFTTGSKVWCIFFNI